MRRAVAKAVWHPHVPHRAWHPSGFAPLRFIAVEKRPVEP